jgi:hypothetical protein
MDTRRFRYATVRAVPKYPRITGGTCAALLLLGLLACRLGATGFGTRLSVLAGLAWTIVTGWWVVREVLPSQTSRGAVVRRADRQQRAGGVASLLDVAEHASPTALRRRAKVLRPSLADVRRRKIRPTDLGVQIARTGLGLWGQAVWISCEDTTLRVGGPRTGKTLSLACHGLDAPGALVTTSTRLDLAEMVQPARHDRPVHLFNPAGLGDLPSTVRWSILVGCIDFTTAARRAADLIPESGSTEGERWDAQARRVLALLLHAAALAGKRVADLQRWLGDLGSTNNAPRALAEVVDALSVLPSSTARVSEVRAFWGTNDRTRTSVTAMIAPALAWMSDDAVRAIGDAPLDSPPDGTGPDGITLDVHRLIVGRETLHILGHEDRSVISPLTAALTAEIAHQARQLASTRPGGRLDPPLTMLLDEAALVCRVPLHRWTADFGGRNITVHISVQSLSQLRDRWGDAAAGTILGNVGALIVFGGGREAGDLVAISTLTGEHRQKVQAGSDGLGLNLLPTRQGSTGGPRFNPFRRSRNVSVDVSHQEYREHRWVPVMTPAQIGALPPEQVLVLRRGLDAVIGRAPLATGRRGWRQQTLAAVAVPTAPLATVTRLGGTDADTAGADEAHGRRGRAA